MARRNSPNKGTPWIEAGMIRVPDQAGQVEQTLRVGSAPWYAWLRNAAKFYVKHPEGNFFCRKEGRQRGGTYWSAYRRANGNAYHVYLGKDAELTVDLLDTAAGRLTAQQHKEQRDGTTTEAVH